MAENWNVIYTTAQLYEAELVREIMADNDIECVIMNKIDSIYGFGDIEIQTAAEMGATTYHKIAKPNELKDWITTAQEEYKQNNILSQAQKLAESMSSNSIDAG